MRTKIKILLLTATSFLFALNIANAQTCGTSQVTYSGYTSNYVPKWNVTSGCISNSSIFDNGNVGIGTATPVAKLQVYDGGTGASASEIFNLKTTYTSNSAQKSLTWRDGTDITGQIDTRYDGTDVNMVFGHLYHSGYQTTDLMTILGSGNVGIGTTAPGAVFDIATALPSQATYGSQNWSVSGNANYNLRLQTIWNGSGINYNYVQKFNSVDYNVLSFFTGNVGIGTTSPLAKLHLNNGSVLFDGTTGATPTSGAGARMMWIPSKIAFRAGNPNGAYWDDVNIGYYSTAFGLSTTASGQRSFAIGQSTVASGWYSFATGNASVASGQSSSSFGNSTIASGDFTTAFGLSTTAQPYGSFVIGRFNIISGTTTSWVATDPLFVIGNGSSTSVRSNALTVLKNGNVLINKTTQLNSLYKLDIDGTMRVNEIVVNLTGADFVFNSNYKLLPLKELELFIKENNHLPEIASAEEMETGDGVKIGEMQTQLLQKIEELTLYIIELNNKIEAFETK